jgi:WD40 repeat protein/uncharacterized caspase-like protein
MRRLLSSILFLQAFFLSLAFTAKAQQPRLIIPMGQRNGYYNVSLSPDGKHALTAGGRTAIIWEIGSGAVAAELSRPDLDIREAFYSPDGQRVLTTGSETAALWDAATGQLVTELKGMNKAIVDQHFSPDGSSILIVCTDETARLYSARTGQLQKLLHIPPSPTARQQLGDLAVVRLQNAAFSPDGKKIAFNRSDDLTAVIDLTTGKIVRNIPSSLQDSDEDDEHFEGFCTVEYSPDGRQVVTGSYNGSLSIWNASTGRLLRRWKAHPAAIFLAHYSPDGTRLITKDLDNRAALWQSSTGALLTDLKSETALGFLCFNRDGTRIATGYDGGLLYLRDAQGQPLKKMQTGATGIPSLAFSNNGQQIAVAAFDRTTRIFRIADGRQIAELKGHADVLRGLALSPDGKTIWSFTGAISYNWNMATGRLIGVSPITGIVQRYCWDPTGERLLTRESFATPAPVKIWDTRTGQELFALQAPPGPSGRPDLATALFNPAGTKVLTTYLDSTARIWDAATGQCLTVIDNLGGLSTAVTFSPDGTTIAIGSFDSTVRVWDAFSGKLLLALPSGGGGVKKIQYSPDGAQLMAIDDDAVFIWNSHTGALLFSYLNDYIRIAGYNPDGKTFFMAGYHDAGFRDVRTGQLLQSVEIDQDWRYKLADLQFSPDGKRLITYYYGTADVWDAATGQRLSRISIPLEPRSRPIFDPQGDRLIMLYPDNTIKVLDLLSGNLLYSFFAVDSTDYLVYDPDSRYDGTEAARKLLYYTCGTEVISLDQVKDLLWVPNLAERILRHDSINAPRLADLQICGLAPLVLEGPKDSNVWHFIIHPRRGGLGTTVLYVNGNETRRYKPADLKKTSGAAAGNHPARTTYELSVPKAGLTDILVPGQGNPVTVKAFTASDDLVSRGATVTSAADSSKHTVPNLYAVMVGVSDYKGDGLDLKYAAKDATDLSHAIGAAAKKWLGNEHVFLYNLTTDPDHYRQPEKAAIRQTMEEIGKKATASDILLIFFAGHGVMGGSPKKQFYFLTADASPETATGSAVAQVGISTKELTEWIQPANIKAQKRILILDACNSGQVINDIVHVGETDQQFAVARNDDNAEQVKSIDKLNERCGLFILAASASNQNAYEMSRYSQGLLTYALLKTIKEDPTVLENDKYLNIAPWFDHARNTVTQLVKDNGARQEPQLVSTTNFDIGIVDAEVAKNIRLSNEYALFTSSNFINKDELVGGDDLGLSGTLDRHLHTLATRGEATTRISYIPSDYSPDAWSLSGNYSFVGDSVRVNVNIWQDKKNRFHFAAAGLKREIDGLSAEIVDQALTWINEHKSKE